MLANLYQVIRNEFGKHCNGQEKRLKPNIFMKFYKYLSR